MVAMNNHKLDKATDRLYMFAADKKMYQVFLGELVAGNGMTVASLVEEYEKSISETERLNSILAGILEEAGTTNTDAIRVINNAKDYSIVVENEEGFVTDINKVQGKLITKQVVTIPSDLEFGCYYTNEKGELVLDDTKYLQLSTVL